MELEYSGQQKEVPSEPVEQQSDDDDKDKKKKEKKGKKKEKAEVISTKVEVKTTEDLEENNMDHETEVSIIKSAAQKKKEKKEREKQKKLAAKKAVCNILIPFLHTEEMGTVYCT